MNAAQFAELGVICIKGAIPKSKTDPAKACLLDQLSRLRLRENGKWHTKKLDGLSPFRVAAELSQSIKSDPRLDAVIPDELVASLAELAGSPLRAAAPHPQILVTPPQKAEWSLPEHGWHVDVAAPATDRIPGIQVFVLLDDVAPRGGGTLAIAGSHRDRARPPTPDSVVEMCGRAGDVYVMDMRVRHAPSVNATKNARLMLTARYMTP